MVGKGREREKIKIVIPFCSVPALWIVENSKKIGKKFKKLKTTTMASFEAKTRWERLRMRENKNYSSVPSLPDAKLKITKKQR